MKGLAICLRGIEDTCALEAEEITGKKPAVKETVVVFDADEKTIAKACYRMQSAVKVLGLLGEFEAGDYEKTLEGIKKAVEGIDFSFMGGKSFRVKCKRIGNDSFHSNDIEPDAGSYVLDKIDAKVDLDSPDVIIYIYIYKNSGYIGIDYSGFDLSKRDYKVFVHPSSLNSTIAYALVRMSGSKAVNDPFCGSGTIPIEAELFFRGKSPHFFKKDRFALHKIMKIDLGEFDEEKKTEYKVKASDQVLHSVKATKNNAKLAGVEINVSRNDVEWLDTKLDEKAWDLVTNPPSVSRQQDRKAIAKLYKEFFYQAEYVVKDRIVLCVENDEIIKEELEHFKIDKENSVWQGKKQLKVLMLSRQKI